MNAKGIEAVEGTMEQGISAYAKLHRLSEAEATERYFAENPEAYKLAEAAHRDRARLGVPKWDPNSRKETPTTPAKSFAEDRLESLAKERMRKQPGMTFTEALSEVCDQYPALYREYDLKHKRGLNATER